MNSLYLECYSGISGDMTVAALLDLGADQSTLEKVLKSLPVHGFSVNVSRVKKAGLDVCDFHVILEDENHDHDMTYLHPHTSHPAQELEDPHAVHSHESAPVLDGHSHQQKHTHKHRSLSDILSIIQKADMTDHAKQIAIKIFHILGEAEAQAHGTTIEQVHFHEAGAVDSIVDIVSVAVCLDNLKISDVIIPVLYEGTGTIRCQHGILPVPVPATTNIIQTYQIPLRITDLQGEFVTPTGAAITAAIRTSGQLPKQFCILRTGLGGGKRTYERPSILRAMLIQADTVQVSPFESDFIYKLETNIDDCTGEMMGHVMDCLLQAGARDVHYFPAYMKKNRPAYQLNVLCSEADIPKMEQIIFTQTTTIGIRKQRMERSILPRKVEVLQTSFGEIRVKICDLDGSQRIYPEYDSVAHICQQTGKSFPEIYCKLQEICREQCT